MANRWDKTLGMSPVTAVKKNARPVGRGAARPWANSLTMAAIAWPASGRCDFGAQDSSGDARASEIVSNQA